MLVSAAQRRSALKLIAQRPDVLVGHLPARDGPKTREAVWGIDNALVLDHGRNPKSAVFGGQLELRVRADSNTVP